MESIGLHGGEYSVTWRLLGYIVESIGLHVGSVELYGGESWVTWWSVELYGESVGLHGGLLDYMVGCWVTCQGLLGCIIVESWLTLTCIGLHGRVLV